MADCKVELSTTLSKIAIFGGFPTWSDIFGYLIVDTKAIPCLVCEVRYPSHNKLDDLLILHALKYLISVYSHTGCDVVFGLISTYETTHVIWIKKVGVDYDFDATMDKTKLEDALNGFGSSDFLPTAPVAYTEATSPPVKPNSMDSFNNAAPEPEAEPEEMTPEEKASMLNEALALWKGFDVGVSKEYKRSELGYVQVLYNVVLQSIKATLFTKHNQEKPFCEAFIQPIDVTVYVPRPVSPTYEIFPHSASRAFYILDHIQSGNNGYRVCSAMFVTKAIKATKTTSEVKSVGKFCMLKMRYATETSPKPSKSFTGSSSNKAVYNQRLLKEKHIWNCLIAKTDAKSFLSKVFLVEDICGYRLLVMPYLFPLLEVLKSVEDYKKVYEPQIRAQIEVMWKDGWMHGDLVLRHVGLWDCGGREFKVQLFGFGNATGTKGDKQEYIENELTKLRNECEVHMKT